MMPWSTAAGREQLWRVARIVAVTLGSSAVVVNLVNTWEIRYPLLGMTIGLCEVIYHAVMAEPVSAARHAAVSGPPAEQVYTPVTQSPAEVQPPGDRPTAAS